MPANQFDRIVQHLRRAEALVDGGELSDANLLESFISRCEQSAFEAIVRRHGPMVLNACRRILGNAEDAEDAFQAAFLVLARKAKSIRRGELLAGWLYRVACRAAQEAKGKATQRRLREKQVNVMRRPAIEAPAARDDLSAVLDDELSRLPDKYRIPVILCELEGRSRSEVARQLKLPEGTLSSRLATARKMLMERLERRGLSTTGGALAAVLSPSAASACLPPALVSSLAKAATSIAAGNAGAAASISSQVATLTEGVLRSMFLTKMKIGAIACAIIVAGAGAMQMLAAMQAEPRQSAQADEKKKAEGSPNLKEVGLRGVPSVAPPKEIVNGDKKLDQDDKYAAPIWGKPENGLRIGLCQAPNGAFMAILENVGADDFVLRLGVTLANGKKQFPTAVRLSFTDVDGTKRTWQRKFGFVGGRIDPLVVPLGAGCRYSIKLLDFDDSDPLRMGVPIKAGKHQVAVEFVGKAVAVDDANQDVRGMTLMPYWTGTVTSGNVAFEVDGAKEPNTSLLSVETLIADLKSPDGKVRVAATRELFDRGQKALPELKKAGGKNIALDGTVDTSRLDGVYSLIEGLRPDPTAVRKRYVDSSFGLNLDKGTTAEELSLLGKKYGFQLIGTFDFAGQPNCYVTLNNGKNLSDVLKRLLTEEPKVVRVNLNYRE